MTHTVVKKTDGTTVIVSNTVLNSAGAEVVVSDDVLDTGAGVHTIFSATFALVPVSVVEFIVTANRIFEV